MPNPFAKKQDGFIGIVLLVVVAVIALGVIGMAWRVVSLPGRAIDRTIGTAEGVIDQTLTADNAIYNYEWFKQQKEDITASEIKAFQAKRAVENFETLSGPRKDWTFEDKTEWARLSSVHQGLLSQRENLIADYNARAKMANRAIFLDGKIPAFIEVGASFLK